MTYNWYAVYTKSNKERKVSSLLAKKGIESFCPIISSPDNKSTGRKPVFQALFNSYVFVYVTEAEVAALKLISGVINLVYWKAKPAIIKKEEIDILKQLTTNYSTIRLEKTAVDTTAEVKVIDEPQIAYKENSISVKYNKVKVNLPSLGFTMIAERIKKKEEVASQERSLFASFPQKINALFFN